MASTTFDLKGQLRFDETTCTVHDSSNQRLLVVPAAALDELLKNAGRKASSQFGTAVGRAAGARVAARLGGAQAVLAAGLEAVLTQIAGELTVVGLGRVTAERWGRAMVLVVDGAASDDDAFVAAVLEGAMGTATGRAVRCVALGREGTISRALVCSETGAQRARQMLGEGASWSAVVVRLQGGAS